MQQTDLHVYESDHIKITFDKLRCTHVGECVRNLPQVFNPLSRPWIDPAKADPEEVADVVERCPTGALHYVMTERKEKPARPCQVRIASNGSIYLKGRFKLHDPETLHDIEDTRFALCRCGRSEHQPACDNQHKRTGFKSELSRDSIQPTEAADVAQFSKLNVLLVNEGPAVMNGSYQLSVEDGYVVSSDKTLVLCRCGRSLVKPYCDGSHDGGP
ncbi:hypothetical protein P9112_003594 [Eukaryota sp. TZLM1-RC]